MLILTHARILPANLLLVILRREQRVQFSGIAQFDFEKPAARVWLGVHQGGIVGDGFVQRHNFAADGRINVARGLHGFHHGAGFAGFHLAPNFGQLDKNDIGQFMLRMIGDADRRRVAADAHPFVRLGVFQI
jgi:hypothetical protein